MNEHEQNLQCGHGRTPQLPESILGGVALHRQALERCHAAQGVHPTSALKYSLVDVTVLFRPTILPWCSHINYVKVNAVRIRELFELSAHKLFPKVNNDHQRRTDVCRSCSRLWNGNARLIQCAPALQKSILVPSGASISKRSTPSVSLKRKVHGNDAGKSWLRRMSLWLHMLATEDFWSCAVRRRARRNSFLLWCPQLLRMF